MVGKWHKDSNIDTTGKRYYTSPPLIGSEGLLLKCLSYIIVVIRPAGTGNGGVGNKGVKNIGQPNRAEKNIE